MSSPSKKKTETRKEQSIAIRWFPHLQMGLSENVELIFPMK